MPIPFGAYDREGLEYITNGYSQDNVIGEFQLGKIYRGRHPTKPLLIKVWDKDQVDGYQVWPEDSEARLMDEARLVYDHRLQSHPNMIKIKGISWPDLQPTLVYELNADALDTVHNLQDKDSFSWLHRVKVALGIASLVKCMHGCQPLPYLIRNISAAHIILDQDYNAKLFDFSMISGGILADKTELLNQQLQGCYGYIDPDYVSRGKWSKKCDVFAFGVVLIGLVSKKVPLETKKESHEPFLYEWVHSQYLKKCPGPILFTSKFSLAHKSFVDEPFFCARDGFVLTKLALQCVDYDPKKRPTMKQVFNCLLKLSVVRNSGSLLSLGNIKPAGRLAISDLCWLIFKNLKVSLQFEGKPSKNVVQYWATYTDELVDKAFRWTVFKSLKVSLRSKEKALKTLFKHMPNKDKLVSAGKGWRYLPPNRLSYEDIKSYTNGFSKENFISFYRFGNLYHGKMDSLKVTVKTWEDLEFFLINPGDNETRLREELLILKHPRFVSHPHIVKLIGYCYEKDKLCAVYNQQSLDSLSNLISEDSFTWHKRIVFILEFARLLKYLQQTIPPCSPYVLRNISPNDILVDNHYMPKLFDFGMLLGGIMNDQEAYRIRHVHGWEYYTDQYTNCYDYYTEVSDIYSLGMVILNMITKRCYIDSETEFDEWVRNEFEKAKSGSFQQLRHFSLVNEEFFKEVNFDPCDGQKVTKIAMQCIQIDYLKRPSINQVVKQLKNLKAMRKVSNSS